MAWNSAAPHSYEADAVAKRMKHGRDQRSRGSVFATGQDPASSLYCSGPRLICVVRECKN
eukprot:3405805-Amphidinium_carterae.1